MFTIKFKIYHKTCWGSTINIEFPNHKFSSIDCRWVKKSISHLVKIEGDSKYFEDIEIYLKNREDTTEVHKVSVNENILFLKVLTIEDDSHDQFSNQFFENNCFMVEPTQFIDKFEFWTFASISKENITSVYSKLSKFHPCEIIYLKKDSISSYLTPKQREAILQAQYLGYYEFPRKISIVEICSILKISKTTFLSHLRKAESKIITSYIFKNSL